MPKFSEIYAKCLSHQISNLRVCEKPTPPTFFNIFWCRLRESVRKSIYRISTVLLFWIFFSESRGARKTVDPRGETTFARAARLRKKISKNQDSTYTINGLSDRFPKTASKNIEKRRRSRLLRDVHFHEIANWDTGDLVQFWGLFGSQIFIIQLFDLFFGYDT